jgi:hypothetical protein
MHRAFYRRVGLPTPPLRQPEGQIWAYFIDLTVLMSIPGAALAIGFNGMFAATVPTGVAGDRSWARATPLTL